VVRFSNEVVNVGIGPLELRPASATATATATSVTIERSYQPHLPRHGRGRALRPGCRRPLSNAVGGPVHTSPCATSTALRALAEYAAPPAQAPGSNGPSVVAGKKVSSCVLDTKRRLPKAPGSPRRKFYGNLPARLGRRHLHWWGDLYGSRVSGQELDISRSPTAHTASSRAPTREPPPRSNERTMDARRASFSAGRRSTGTPTNVAELYLCAPSAITGATSD